MDAILLTAVFLATSAALFYLGTKYGAAVEQEFVAKALAEYASASAVGKAAVIDILVHLKNDYRTIYGEIVTEFDKVEKAL